MINVYGMLRLNSLIRNVRIKMFGIWLLHVLKKRYIGIFFDPVLACNFRCKMCYFSDEEKRKIYRGIFEYGDIEQIGKDLFYRALKLQIGCGAEPTLHKNLVQIVALGKQYGIPHISLTTNGSLLNKTILGELVAAGLHEITLSTHGFTREMYEMLMTNGKFDIFKRLLDDISEIKVQYPGLKFRINYTINNDNLDELSQIWEVIGKEVDVLQLRPVQRIGNSEYTDFDLTKIYERYDNVLLPLIRECKERNVICIAPAKENIVELEKEGVTDNRIEQATYCYISPKGCWKEDFNYWTETFESYAKRHRLGWKLFRQIFEKPVSDKVNVTRKMNYSVK